MVRVRFSGGWAVAWASGAALIVASGLAGSPAAAGSSREPGQSASQTRKDLARVRDRISDLEQQRRKTRKQRSELESQLRETELSASRLRKSLDATTADLGKARGRLSELQHRIEATTAELGQRRDELAGQLRLAQITGGTERVQALFNQQDPAALDRELTWLGYVARNRGELLGSIQASLDALERDRADAAEQAAALASLEARRREQLSSLESARTERAAVMADLDADAKGRARELAKARSEAASLEKVLRELQRAAERARQQAAPAPDKPAPGDEGRPLGKGRWPVQGTMLADFGQPRAGGKMTWDGVLIAAPAGTAVRAVRAGKVVYADWLPGLGLLLVLDHGDGYLSLYGHNQDLTRKVGDHLAAGDVLAHVGDTGGQARSALYYEVRRNGRPLDPRRWGN